MMVYLQHPLSAAFPAMSTTDFLALKENVKTIGVQNPITLFGGMVIDGWHRYTAAQEVGAECPAVLLVDIDPQAFVVAQNKARRHISQGQLAMAVASVYEWSPIGKPANSAPGAELQKTTKQLAEIAGVGTRTMEQAKKVIAKATPEVQAKVKDGKVSVKAAVAELTPKAAPVIEPEDDGAPDAAEMAALAMAEQSDREAMEKLLDADDKLATAYTEIKRLNAELAQMRISRDGYMNKCNEAIALVKKRDRQISAMERAQREAVA